MKEQMIHFIGIGGIGVSGLAEYFLSNGYNVSGSDISESHITKRLEGLGAKIYIGHSATNISSEVDTVVYTSAAKKDNPEIIRTKELGKKLLKRAEMLGSIVNKKFLIAVAGTHGKTTTTAMIGKLLIDAGFDPLIFVGGNVELFDGGASRFGKGKFAVVEADEYDRSFLTLKPDIAVITNVDEDHLDIYKDLNDIKKTFLKFCRLSKENAKIVYCGDDSNINDFINNTDKGKFSYGFDDKNYLRIKGFNVKGEELSFNILNSKSEYNDIKINLIGRHNVLNSAACFAVSKVLNIDFNLYKQSMKSFKTVDRRLQLKYNKDGIKVFDDYAHHPKEIASSLKGLKETYTGSRLITVFQPHLYSRTRDLYKEFAQELSLADEVVLIDIYPAREEPIEGISSELIFKELLKTNVKASYVTVTEKLLKNLEKIKKGDIVVFQGAGDITNICAGFVQSLEKK
ncbi:MAG TPA: UDP-N-acetylmuramate--L-alanine ligase [Ignavibacteria bacterium]|jgi:UDP-N-acetylmuramate--alanine ligase